MIIKKASPGDKLVIGQRGEHLARGFVFDMSCWEQSFGTGTAQLLVQRAGDDTPYPVALQQADTGVLWQVSDSDTAVQGWGKYELQYYVDEILAKSVVSTIYVGQSLGDAGPVPPDPQQSWVEQVLSAGAQAAESAGTAAESAEDAQGSADEAARLLEEFETPVATATSLPSGSPATATYDGHTFAFGIPVGEKGDPGPNGVYVGTEEPTDPEIRLWINPDGEPDAIEHLEAEVDALNQSLTQLNEDKVDKTDYAPVTKTDAMTQPVGKDADGKLWTAAGGGGLPANPAAWPEWSETERNTAKSKIGITSSRLLAKITLEEDAYPQISIPDGVTDFIVVQKIYGKTISGVSANICGASMYLGTVGNTAYNPAWFLIGGQLRGAYLFAWYSNHTNSEANAGIRYYSMIRGRTSQNVTFNKPYPAGTEFEIYEVST